MVPRADWGEFLGSPVVEGCLRRLGGRESRRSWNWYFHPRGGARNYSSRQAPRRPRPHAQAIWPRCILGPVVFPPS